MDAAYSERSPGCAKPQADRMGAGKQPAVPNQRELQRKEYNLKSAQGPQAPSFRPGREGASERTGCR